MTLGRFRLLAAGVVALALCSASPAFAADDAKALLGRAQTKSESQAVEDLIKKLQGPADKRPAPPPAAAPAPAPPPQDVAKTPVPEPVTPPPPAATPPAPPKPATPPPVETARPAPVTPPPAPEATTKPPPPAPEVVAKPVVPEQKETPPPAAATATVSADTAQQKADRKELPAADLEVYFEYKSAKVSTQATEVLNTLGRALVDGRLAGDKFLIAGHTDARGDPRQNLALSQKRAESVRKFLIDNFSIDAAKLEAKGYGEVRLKNQDDPNADENRRVQIVNISAAEARR